MSNSIPALELRGRVLSVTRLRVNTSDSAAIAAQLQALSEQMPQGLAGMPVLLDAASPLELSGLLKQLRDAGLQPIGVAQGALAPAAAEAGLAVLPDTEAVRPPRTMPAPAAPAAPAPRRSTRIVDSPVRSGQQVYAEGADLIVTGQVSPGAEVIADGCVHVHGAARGRVIAGARGDINARAFCHRFEAELVAVAGVYAVAEQMQNLRGAAVQALLDNGRLRIERLG